MVFMNSKNLLNIGGAFQGFFYLTRKVVLFSATMNFVNLGNQFGFFPVVRCDVLELLLK